DDAQVLVVKSDLPRIDDLNPNFLLASPVGVQARRQDVAEAAVDPNERPLVVLEIKHKRASRERIRLDDHVELLVDQPRRALRDNLDASLAKQVQQPV